MTEIHSSFICNITVSWFLSILRKSTRRPDVFSCFKGRKLYCGVESVKRAEFSVLNVFNHNPMSTQLKEFLLCDVTKTIHPTFIAASLICKIKLFLYWAKINYFLHSRKIGFQWLIYHDLRGKVHDISKLHKIRTPWWKDPISSSWKGLVKEVKWNSCAVHWTVYG